MAGESLSFADREKVSYQSPRLRAQSMRARGTVVMPRGEALARERDRRNTARDIRYNPLSGKRVAVRAVRRVQGREDDEAAPFSRRTKTTPAAARLKAAQDARIRAATKEAMATKGAGMRRPKLAPEYVGRRRAEP